MKKFYIKYNPNAIPEIRLITGRYASAENTEVLQVNETLPKKLSQTVIEVIDTMDLTKTEVSSQELYDYLKSEGVFDFINITSGNEYTVPKITSNILDNFKYKWGSIKFSPMRDSAEIVHKDNLYRISGLAEHKTKLFIYCENLTTHVKSCKFFFKYYLSVEDYAKMTLDVNDESELHLRFLGVNFSIKEHGLYVKNEQMVDVEGYLRFNMRRYLNTLTDDFIKVTKREKEDCNFNALEAKREFIVCNISPVDIKFIEKFYKLENKTIDLMIKYWLRMIEVGFFKIRKDDLDALLELAGNDVKIKSQVSKALFLNGR